MSALEKSKQPSIDPETLAKVTREVIARLLQTSRGTPSFADSGQDIPSKTNRTAASMPDRVVTSDTISRLPPGTGELFVPEAAVITPSARDEARARGIAINSGTPSPTTSPTPSRQAKPLEHPYLTSSTSIIRIAPTRLPSNSTAAASRHADRRSSSATLRPVSSTTNARVMPKWR